jgi:hypothetical protein
LPSATTTFDAKVACGRFASAAGIWRIGVDGLLAEVHQLRLLLVDQRLQQLRDCRPSFDSIRIARYAPIASAVRGVS